MKVTLLFSSSQNEPTLDAATEPENMHKHEEVNYNYLLIFAVEIDRL